MRISEADREEAIEVLLCCADAWIRNTWEATYTISDGDVERIASESYRSVFRTASRRYDDRDEIYLEAAALLRDGWSPGDPVVRRGGGS